MISLQEELDWQVLAAYGLVRPTDSSVGAERTAAELGQRAFEIVLARKSRRGAQRRRGSSGTAATPITEIPAKWPAEYRAVVERRIELIESDPDVGLIERPEHKRRWNRASWDERSATALIASGARRARGLRTCGRTLRLRSTAELTDVLRRTRGHRRGAGRLLADAKTLISARPSQRLVLEAAVPHLAAQR